MTRAVTFFILLTAFVFITCQTTPDKPGAAAAAVDATKVNSQTEKDVGADGDFDVNVDRLLDQFIEENKDKLNLDDEDLDEMIPHVNRKIQTGQEQEQVYGGPDHTESFEDDEEEIELPHGVRTFDDDDEDDYEDVHEDDIHLRNSARFFHQENDLDYSVHMADPRRDTEFAHSDEEEDFDADEDDDEDM